MNKSILIIGGVHGNEPLGIKLVELLLSRPIEGVDATIANENAVKQNRRFIGRDLNRSFGSRKPASAEEKIASKLEKLCKKYDLVLDFHNTQTPENDCSFVGINSQIALLSVSSILGLNSCIKATYDCINKYCPNVLSVEISLSSRRNDEDYWYEKIAELIQVDLKFVEPLASVYRFQRRVTWEEKAELDTASWKPFVPITEADKLMLGVDGIIAPIFIGSKLTEYYATLVSKERV